MPARPDLRGRGKDLVCFGALLAALLWGSWLFMRTQLELGSGWTDGLNRYDQLTGDRIRYAVWDTPLPLGATVNADGTASRPALSPDGRFLVFAAGERGLNADLFVSELVQGEPAEPRSLLALNTTGDELAPAFGHDALYFATDRSGSAFGLDLWRASYSDGVFGPPEPIGAGINTVADESDPCPVPGSMDLLFTSNRLRGARVDYDLYQAQLDLTGSAARTYTVAAFEGVNTPFDEREPSLTADGRTLIFASDRAGSQGGFDLYRSFFEIEGWLPPETVRGVNTDGSERGPVLSPDGFRLFFEKRDAAGMASLWRARSLELFRVPAPPLSLEEILFLLALLVLAILAFLARYWRAIDILYKCFLVSLLVHMVLMWYLRQVFPESGESELRTADAVFRVRLAPSPTGVPTAARERNGELELAARTVEEPEAAPSRAESGEEMSAAAPTLTDVQAPERELEAPTRSDAELAENRRTEDVRSALEEREAPLERQRESAPGLTLAEREAAAAPTTTEANTPSRAATTVELQAAAPASVPLEVQRSESEAGGELPAPVRVARVEAASGDVKTALEEPRESFEGARAEAPPMRLPEVTVAEARRVDPGEAMRRETNDARRSFEGEARPSANELAASPDESRTEAPQHQRTTAADTSIARGDPEVDVRGVHETPPADLEARESVRFDATSDLAETQERRTVAATSDPARFDVAPDTARSENAFPTTRDVSGLVPVRNPLQDSEVPRGATVRTETTPTPNGGTDVAVREVEEAPSGTTTAEPIEPRRFDPLADLARNEPKRFRPTERVEREQPARFVVPENDERATPRARELAALTPPAQPDRDELPRRLEQTPYKNRFGQEKLRALEEYGGGEETERAVAAGLAYLARIQDGDGHWGERRDYHDKYGDVRVGKTGLAMLAFLGAGHTQQSDTEYSDVVERAMAFLFDLQERNGHFGDSSAYSHGIATYALAECYALTQDERIKGRLERGVRQILRAQSERQDPRFFGGWGYYYRNDRVWNNDPWPRVSVTAWQVMALESARIGGLSVPDEAFDDARTFLLNSYDPPRQAFRYSHDPNRLSSGYPILPASTPAALFALSLLGVDVSRQELGGARSFVLQRAPRDFRYTSDDDFVAHARGNLYFWYYGTLSMFRVGGTAWKRWNASMKEVLLEAQEDDGSWDPISIYCGFAGDDPDEKAYSTAMCVLSLEVYYRYFTPLLEVR